VEFWLRQRTASIPFLNENYWADWGEVSLTRPTFRDPDQTVPGELSLVMDSDKRLSFLRVLPVVETKPRVAPHDPDWPDWFTPEMTGFHLEAGNDRENADAAERQAAVLHRITDRIRTPPDAYDAVGVWSGIDPDTGEEVVVQTTSFRGRPSLFERFKTADFEEALNIAALVQGSGSLAQGRNFLMGIYFCLLVASVLLAWYNLRSGRGDRRGALRLAGCVFCLRAVVWLTYARHYTDVTFEIALVITIGLSQVLFDAARAWLWYMALEPFVRRIWPRVLIPWSRLLDGRWRNPLVGRDLLLGVLAGTVSTLLFKLNTVAHLRFSESTPAPVPTNPLTLDGTKELIGTALDCYARAIMIAMFGLLMLVILRITLQSERRAIVVNLIIMTPALTLLFGGYPAISVIPVVLHVGLFLTVLVRLGFLALVLQMSTVALLEAFPLTSNANVWYFSHGMFAVVWVTAIALYGSYTSLGGLGVFGAATTKPK
jgi:hypothetical protein